ncbi:MAG: CHAT domain-containing protein [Hormoscilla sp.]
MIRRSPRKRIRLNIILGLLTFLLVTTVVPAVSQRSLAVAPQRAVQLLARGKELYQVGKLSEATRVWQQAAQAYQEQGDILRTASIWKDMSHAYQDLGRWSEAGQAIANSLEILENIEQPDNQSLSLEAQSLNAKGYIELARGQTQAALETWIQAEAVYEQAGNEMGKVGSQINQAQALQTLGQYRKAKKQLEQVNEQLQGQPDSLLKAAALRSLGRALQVVGDLIESKEILEQSWAISRSLGAGAETSGTLLSIGNIARDLQAYDVALAYYREAAKVSGEAMGRVEAQLNQLSLLVEMSQWAQATALIPRIESLLSQLPESRSSVYARVNMAASLMKMPENYTRKTSLLLAEGVQQARNIRDAKAEAYALNQLGSLYARQSQWSDAQKLTEQALKIAQNLDAAEIVARASWQLGQVLKQEGEITEAIGAYKTAFNTLETLGRDLVAINPEVQFNFKETVEPVYRQLVSLLLRSDSSQADLQQAREVIEALQLAELENFFQEACLETKPVLLDEVDATAAVIYPILLPDRLEVILSLPDGTLDRYATSSESVDSTLKQLYSSLHLAYDGDRRLQLSQQVYDWLIRPAEVDLAKHNVKTLVFVLDGFLQNLPMAALYDGQEYLIEKYSIAMSSGLQLLEPEKLAQNKIKALTVGLTEARSGFSALPGVELEVKEISEKIDSEVLLDREFTSQSFQDQIEAVDFSVVHLATHGQFSSNPDETFLLTWDGRINVKEFDRLLQNRGQQEISPIELLVLSACQTADGDSRAALGLAGMAVRSGARSTLATLWSVNDQSTAELMIEFYRQLTKRDITKAQALRAAQLALLKDRRYNHPFFWAPFVLVGNWL